MKRDKLLLGATKLRKCGLTNFTNAFYQLYRKRIENERQTIKTNCNITTISQGHPKNSEKENKNREESFSVHNIKKKSQTEKKISKEMCKLIKEEE